VIAFRVTDKFLRKRSPRRVGYTGYGTKWDHKAWQLIPDLISASLLGATDLFSLNELNVKDKLYIAVWTKKDAKVHCD